MPITHLIAAAAAAQAANIVANSTRASSTSSIITCHSDLDWETLEDDLREPEEVKHPVLVDTDGGPEDAWGLLMCLRAHKDPKVPFDLVGITCVHGGTDVDTATRNVRKVLVAAGVHNIPLYRGAESAIVRGFKENELKVRTGQEIDPCTEEVNGVNAIIEVVNKYKGKLRILALGPLTNFALAVRVNPDIQHHLRSLFLLGGNTEGTEDCSIAAEFNFACDPEAAHVVLTAYSCPIFILPWETCSKFGTSEHTWRVNRLGNVPTKEVTLMNSLEAGTLTLTGDNSWVAAGALCAAIFIEPRVVVRRKKYHCTVELQGSETRGMLVVDHKYRKGKSPNVVLIQEVSLPLFESMLMWGGGGKFYKTF